MDRWLARNVFDDKLRQSLWEQYNRIQGDHERKLAFHRRLHEEVGIRESTGLFA